MVPRIYASRLLVAGCRLRPLAATVGSLRQPVLRLSSRSAVSCPSRRPGSASRTARSASLSAAAAVVAAFTLLLSAPSLQSEERLSDGTAAADSSTTASFLLSALPATEPSPRPVSPQPSAAGPSTTTSSSSARASSRPYVSSPLYAHPLRPNLSVATAESLDELVGQRAARHQHVLVEVFSPYCHACERLQPVLEQVAHVLSMADRERGYGTAASTSSPAASFLVAVMDESRNHKPGFLTAEEERYLPIIKFFPSAASDDAGLTYTGPPNARAILSFINASLPAAQRIPSSVLQSLLASTSAAAFSAVQAVYRRQRAEEVERDATILLFDHSPCGPEMKEMMEAMLLDRYRSDAGAEDEDEQDGEGAEGGELMRRFRHCMQDRRKDSQAYWKEIHKIASSQLKLDQQRSDDKQKDDKEGSKEKAT